MAASSSVTKEISEVRQEKRKEEEKEKKKKIRELGKILLGGTLYQGFPRRHRRAHCLHSVFPYPPSSFFITVMVKALSQVQYGDVLGAWGKGKRKLE